MKWTPSRTEAPRFWRLYEHEHYMVVRTADGFLPMWMDYSEQLQWTRLSEKGFEILTDAMQVCQDDYCKGSP